MAHRVCVVGAGSWGTAFSSLLAPHADEVTLWARSDDVARGINESRRNPAYVSDLALDPKIRATASLPEAAYDADELVLAVPSTYLRETARALSGAMSESVPILVLTKGMEHETGELMCDVVADELGDAERICVLSGPNHAEEVAAGLVSAAVVAAHDEVLAERFRSLVMGPAFRVYVSGDVVGVELCGAVKNVVAIACGAAAGAGVGDNGIAALMTRGLAEIGRFVTAYGGNPITCMGLAGMGDMVATCTSRHSRNRSFGMSLVEGVTLGEYEEKTHMVVEGARAAKSIHAAARRLGIESPTTDAVYAILYEGMSVEEAVDMLLDRRPREEFYGFSSTGGV